MQVSTAVEGQNGQMVVKRLSVPIGLEELMEGLTKEVISKKPQDIPSFASNYFTKLLELRDKDSKKDVKKRKAAFIVKPLKQMLRDDQNHNKKTIGVPVKLTKQISVRQMSPTKKDNLKNTKTRIKRDVNMNEPKSKMQKSKTVENFDESLKIEGKRPKRAASTESLINRKMKEPKMKSPKKSLLPTSKSVDEKKQTPENSENEKIIPKNSSVEEDQNYIKDGRLTVSPPRILKKTPSVTDKSELEPTSLIVPAIGVATKIIEKSNHEDLNEKNHDENKEIEEFSTKTEDLTNSNQQGDQKIEDNAEKSSKTEDDGSKTIEDAEKQNKIDDDSNPKEENSDTLKSIEEMDITSISEDKEDTKITTKTEELRKNSNEFENSALLSPGNSSSMDQSSVSSYDPDKLRQELVEAETESRLSSFTTSYNPYSLRNEIRNASASKEEEEMKKMSNKEKIFKFVNEVTAAIKIQSLWRGFKVRSSKQKKKENEEDTKSSEREIRAVVKIQSLWRGFKARRSLKEKTSSMFGATVEPPKVDLENLVRDNKLSRSGSEEDPGKVKLEPIEENKSDEEKPEKTTETKVDELKVDGKDSELATINEKIEESEENTANDLQPIELATKTGDLSDQNEEDDEKPLSKDNKEMLAEEIEEKDTEKTEESEKFGETTKIYEEMPNKNEESEHVSDAFIDKSEANEENGASKDALVSADENHESVAKLESEDFEEQVQEHVKSTLGDDKDKNNGEESATTKEESVVEGTAQENQKKTEDESTKKILEENISDAFNDKSKANEENGVSKDALVSADENNETITKLESEDFEEQVQERVKSTLGDDKNKNSGEESTTTNEESVIDGSAQENQKKSEDDESTKKVLEEILEESNSTLEDDKNKSNGEERTTTNEESVIEGSAQENQKKTEDDETTKKVLEEIHEESNLSEMNNEQNKQKEETIVRETTLSDDKNIADKQDNVEEITTTKAKNEDKEEDESGVKHSDESIKGILEETREESNSEAFNDESNKQSKGSFEENTGDGKVDNLNIANKEASVEGSTETKEESAVDDSPQENQENREDKDSTKKTVEEKYEESSSDNENSEQNKRKIETIASEDTNDSLENAGMKMSEEKDINEDDKIKPINKIEMKMSEEKDINEDNEIKSINKIEEAIEEKITKTVIGSVMNEPQNLEENDSQTISEINTEQKNAEENSNAEESVENGDPKEELNETSKDTRLLEENRDKETKEESSNVENEDGEESIRMLNENEQKQPCRSIESKIIQHEITNETEKATVQKEEISNTENEDTNEQQNESQNCGPNKSGSDLHAKNEDSSTDEVQKEQESNRGSEENEKEEEDNNVQIERKNGAVKTNDETAQQSEVAENEIENSVQKKVNVIQEKEEKDEQSSKESSKTDKNPNDESVQEKDELVTEREGAKTSECEDVKGSHETNEKDSNLVPVATTSEKDVEEESKENENKIGEKRKTDEQNSESSKIEATQINTDKKQESEKNEEDNNNQFETKTDEVNSEETKEKTEDIVDELDVNQPLEENVHLNETKNNEKEEIVEQDTKLNGGKVEKDECEEENVKKDPKSDETEGTEKLNLTRGENQKRSEKGETENKETEKEDADSTLETTVSGENSKIEDTQKENELQLNEEDVKISEDAADSHETNEQQDPNSVKMGEDTKSSQQKISREDTPEESKKEYLANEVQQQNVQGNKTKEAKEEDIQIDMKEPDSSSGENEETKLNCDFPHDVPMKKLSDEEIANALIHLDKIEPPPGSPIVIKANEDIEDGIPRTLTRSMTVNEPECVKENVSHLNKSISLDKAGRFVEENVISGDNVEGNQGNRNLDEDSHSQDKKDTLDSDGSYETTPTRPVTSNIAPNDPEKLANSDKMEEIDENTNKGSRNVSLEHSGEFHDSPFKEIDILANTNTNNNEDLSDSNVVYDSSKLHQEIEDVGKKLSGAKEIFGSVENHHNKQKITEDIAATIIQSTFRGHRVRRELGKIGKKLSKIEEENLDKIKRIRTADHNKEEIEEEQPKANGASQENLGKPLVLQNSGEFHDSIPVDFPEKTLKVPINNEENDREDNSKKTIEEDFLQHSSEHHDHVITMSSVHEDDKKQEQEKGAIEDTIEDTKGAGDVQETDGSTREEKNEAVQCIQDQAGDATMTSPTSGAPASAGVGSVVTAKAQAPDKDASTSDDGGRPPDSDSSCADFGMEAEKRNNASRIKKNMEAEAATKIQASFRGYQVRKQLKVKSAGGDLKGSRRLIRRKSSGRITDSGRMSQSKNKVSEIEEKSATKIQAGVRGFLVRRRQQKNTKKEGNES